MGYFRSLLVAGVLLALGAARAADREIIALPPFMVEDIVKGPPWRYGLAPGYEVLSSCSDRATQRFMNSFGRLHQLLGEILPPNLQPQFTVPKTVILYDSTLQPTASQEVIERLALRHTSATSELGQMAPRIQVLSNLRLWDRDALVAFVALGADGFEEERLKLTTNYLAYLLGARTPALPSWFVSGFLTLYQQPGRVSFDNGLLALWPMEWISKDHTKAAQRRDQEELAPSPGIIPLRDFFGDKLPPPPSRALEPARWWQAQAALFVRWGLDVDEAGVSRREALWRFAAYNAVEGVTEKRFKECFGLDFSTADVALATYLRTAVCEPIRFQPARGARSPIVMRDATKAEIARIKGDWERLEIPYVKKVLPDLAPKYLEQARRTLQRAYERGERDPAFLAVMGLCECDAGNDAGAREFLERAARGGELRPRAGFELARLRFGELRKAPAGTEGRLSAAQAAEALRPLSAARAQQPPLVEVYELMADVWANCETPPERSDLAALAEGVRLFPQRTTLVQRAAELTLRQGFRAEAAALVDVGLVLGRSEGAERERLVALRQTLEK